MDKNLFHDRYFLERLLGRGNFSEVWLAKDMKTDIKVALKIYAPATGLDDHGLNILSREFAIVVNANHKNLLKPLYYDSYDRRPYLVLPYCKNGSIQTKIGVFTEEEAWVLLRDVGEGLAYLHSMTPPIIHQDIKPDNIMVGNNGEYMITDFGVSSRARSTLRRSMSQAFSSAGTVAYMAPERFGKDRTPIMASDIWSLGATVFEMITGNPPFEDDGGLLQHKGADVPVLPESVSQELRDVIERCLDGDPWKRPTGEELAKIASDFMDAQTGDKNNKKTNKKGTVILPYSTVKEQNGNKEKLGKAKSKDKEQNAIVSRKWIIPALLIALAAVLLVVVLATKGGESSDPPLEIQPMVKEQPNLDSLRQVAASLVLQASEQIAIGDAHEEGSFERGYIEAKKLLDKAQTISPSDSAKLMTSYVDSMLSESYLSFTRKAEMFADDPEIKDAFLQRANLIKDAMGK